MRVFVYLFVLISGAMVSIAKPQNEPQNEKLPITIYYETLCPGCKSFIGQQLWLSMILFDRLPFADLTLVPYGKANKTSNGEIVCQHGVDECERNAWHACMLEHLNSTNSLNLITCTLFLYEDELDSCAEMYDIDVTDVKKCKETRSVDEILEKYGEETAKVQFQSIPAIAINNVFDEEKQYDLIHDLDKAFCAEYKAKFNKNLLLCE